MAYLQRRGKTWYGRWQKDGKDYARSLGTTSKAVARRKLTKLNAKLETCDGVPKPESPTVGDAIRQYLERTAQEHKPLTRLRYRGILKQFTVYCGKQRVVRIQDLKSSHIENYKDQMIREVEPATVSAHLRAISAFCGKAVRLGWLEKNPVSGIEKPRAKERKVRFYSDAEVERLLEAADKDLYPVLVLLLHTGLREQELCNLTWSDIEGDWLHVREKKDWSPKSGRSRKIPLTPQAKDALGELRRRCSMNSVLVVPSSRGGLERHLLRRIVPLRDRAKVLDATLHAFRHTFATRTLRASGGDIKAVQKLLGHTSLKTTMIYLHAGEEDMKRAVLALSECHGFCNGLDVKTG